MHNKIYNLEEIRVNINNIVLCSRLKVGEERSSKGSPLATHCLRSMSCKGAKIQTASVKVYQRSQVRFAKQSV